MAACFWETAATQNCGHTQGVSLTSLWLTGKDPRNLTAANADLLARNQVLQDSLHASETESRAIAGNHKRP